LVRASPPGKFPGPPRKENRAGAKPAPSCRAVRNFVCAAGLGVELRRTESPAANNKGFGRPRQFCGRPRLCAARRAAVATAWHFEPGPHRAVHTEGLGFLLGHFSAEGKPRWFSGPIYRAHLVGRENCGGGTSTLRRGSIGPWKFRCVKPTLSKRPSSSFEVFTASRRPENLSGKVPACLLSTKATYRSKRPCAFTNVYAMAAADEHGHRQSSLLGFDHFDFVG